MRILQIINTMSSGGAEVFVANLAIAQKKMGATVAVFTYGGAIDNKGEELENHLNEAGISLFSPKIRGNNKLKLLAPIYLRSAIKKFKPDVCHSHLEQSDFFLCLASKLLAEKPYLIRTIHSIYAPDVLPKIIHRMLAKIFSVSVACGPAVYEQYPYLGRNKYIINNGIDISSLSPQKPTTAIRKNLSISDDILLVQIGSFSVRNNTLPKAQDIIVRALAEIKKKNCLVVFLGDGEQRSEIEKLAAGLDVLSQCRFLGRVTNTADYISAADAILMPSRFEGLSIGCIEAACAGKPIIASNITAFSPFRKPSTLFVEPENASDLSAKIDYLMENLPQLKTLSEANKENYCKEFDIQSVANRYMQLYKSPQ